MAILEPTVAAVWGEGELGGLGVAGGGVLLTRPPGNRMTKDDASMFSNKILEAYELKWCNFVFSVLYFGGTVFLIN